MSSCPSRPSDLEKPCRARNSIRAPRQLWSIVAEPVQTRRRARITSLSEPCGGSVVEVARQAGHSPAMTLSTYGHVIEELEGGERRSAEEVIRLAREARAAASFALAGERWRLDAGGRASILGRGCSSCIFVCRHWSACSVEKTSRYETNAFRTVAADHRGPPCGVGTALRFSDSAISSSAIPFVSIALIFIRQP